MKNREIGSALDNKTSILTVVVENAFIVRGSRRFCALLIRLHRMRTADDRSSRARRQSPSRKREKGRGKREEERGIDHCDRQSPDQSICERDTIYDRIC